MINRTSYLDQPCERCGSKKALKEVRNVTLKNLSGTSKIEYSQIICVNVVCQKEFDIDLEQKTLKAEAIKLKREEARAAAVKH